MFGYLKFAKLSLFMRKGYGNPNHSQELNARQRILAMKDVKHGIKIKNNQEFLQGGNK